MKPGSEHGDYGYQSLLYLMLVLYDKFKGATYCISMGYTLTMCNCNM